MDIKDCEELLDGFSTKLKDFDTKEYIITPEWLMEMINANKDYLLQELSAGKQPSSVPQATESEVSDDVERTWYKDDDGNYYESKESYERAKACNTCLFGQKQPNAACSTCNTFKENGNWKPKQQ